MTVSTYNTSVIGCNPTQLDLATTGSGQIIPQFKLGHLAHGDSASEFVYCKLVLASATTLSPGDLYQIDDDFTATALTTSAAARGNAVGVGLVNAPASAQAAAGTYYLWLQINGQAPVRYTTLNANYLTETTATAGACNSPTSATSSSKAIVGLHFTKSPATFTADVTNTSKVLTNLVSVTRDSGPFIGATLSGTGIAASQKIEYITYNAQGVAQTIVLSAAASATNAGVTVTPTLVGEARLTRPYIGATN